MNTLYGRLQTLPLLALLLAGLGTILGLALAEQRWFYAVPFAALIFLIAWPVETTLGAYALLLPFDSISRLGSSPDGRTLTWYAGALATLTLLAMGLLHDRFIRPPRAAKYWLSFLILGVLSVFWALDENALTRELPTVLGVFGLYFAACCFQIGSRELLRVAQLAVLGGVAASLYSILDFFHGVATTEARSSLIAGSQQADPNIFAASLLVPLTLAIGLASAKRSRIETIGYAAAAGAITLAVLLTMSRGALLALIAIAVLYARRYHLNKRLLLALAAAPLSLLVVPALFFSRLQNALASGGAGRADIWTASLTGIRQFGLTGAGLCNFPVAYKHFAGFAPVFRGYARGAHNIYLETTVELGVLGITLLLGAVFSHLRDVRRRQPPAIASPEPLVVACEAMAIGMLIASFFLGMLWEKSFWIVWIFCALIARAANQNGKAMYADQIPLVLTHAASTSL